MIKRKTTRRAKKHNPTARRVTRRRTHSRTHHAVAKRRRRNPSPFAGTGIIADGAWATAGALVTQFVRGMVPINVGGALGDAAITFGVAFILGVAVDKVTKNKNSAKMFTIGGAVAALTQVANSYGLTPAALVGKVAPKQATGMGEIVALRGGQTDAMWGRTGGFPAGGMNDIVAVRPQANY